MLTWHQSATRIKSWQASIQPGPGTDEIHALAVGNASYEREPDSDRIPHWVEDTAHEMAEGAGFAPAHLTVTLGFQPNALLDSANPP